MTTSTRLPPAQPDTSRFRVTLLRLLSRLGPQRRVIGVILTLSVCGIGVGVATPRILGHATDLLFDGVIGRGLPSGMTKRDAVEAARADGRGTFADMLDAMDVVPGRGIDFAAVGRTLVLALMLYLLAAAMIWVQARLLNRVVQQTMWAMRREVEEKTHRLPLRYFDGQRRGELLSRVTNDVDNVQTSLSMTVSQLLSSVLTVGAVLVMMAVISPLLTAIALLTVPVSVLATRAVTRRSQRMFAGQWRATGQLNAHIEETYSGFALVKTFGHAEAARQRFAEHNEELHRASQTAQFLSGLISPIFGLVGNLGYVAVAVLGGIQVATGQVSLGGIQAFIAYLRQFNQPMNQLASMYNALQSGMASADRVFGYLDEPEETEEPWETEEPEAPVTSARTLRAAAATPLTPVTPPTGRVEFRGVGFGYQPGAPVIRDLWLDVPPGTTVGIVGPTGAGKTTLVNLLMRFYEPDAGQILLDGADTARIGRRALRSRFGMVLQDTWLFDGTIAENIGYGRPGAGMAEVVEAAQTCHADHFIRALPDGYRTRIGEGGAGLSAGERQLIAIARAMVSGPQLLILDEATSAVDSRTELLVQQATRELRRGRTSFVIAHRLSSVRDADVIAVLQDGRISEHGSHSELVARRGAYWAMTQS